jgi:ABC-2 type transport system permease protein
VSAAITAFRMQLRLALRTPNFWMAQSTAPPQTLLFLSVIDAFDRPDLVSHALLAPMLISMWGTAVWTGGSVVRDDRWTGRLELHVASPTSYGIVVASRVGAVVLLSLLTVPITLLAAWATYGITISVTHPWLLAAVLAATALAITATGVIFTSMTILSRVGNTFQNSASYPLLLLGGAFVPLALLPGWIQPLGRLVFLSWSSDLLRDSVTAPVVARWPGRLGMVVLLGAIGFYAGHRLIRVIMRRVAVTGTLSSS